jgi:hypothetical protein
LHRSRKGMTTVMVTAMVIRRVSMPDFSKIAPRTTRSLSLSLCLCVCQIYSIFIFGVCILGQGNSLSLSVPPAPLSLFLFLSLLQDELHEEANDAVLKLIAPFM